MEALPILGSAIRHHQRKGLQDWNRLKLNEISPDGGGITEHGKKGMRQLRQQFNKGYDEVVEQAPERLVLSPQTENALVDKITAAVAKLKPDDAKAIEGEAMELYEDLSAGNVPREQAKFLGKELRENAEGAYRQGNVPMGRAYISLAETVSDVLADNIPPEAVTRLRGLDAKYPEYLPSLRGQGMLSPAKNDLLLPENLYSGIRSEDPSLRKAGMATGSRPLQIETEMAEETLGRAIPKMGPGTAEKTLLGLLGGYGLADPAGAGAAAAALAGSGAATFPLAPVLRGNLPGQSAYHAGLPHVPGAPSQIGEAAINFAAGDYPGNPYRFGSR
jgi:hypothetical protein